MCTLNNSKKIELLYKAIERFDLYINSTNNKASLILAWNGIVVGGLLASMSSDFVYKDDSDLLNLLILCFLLIFTLASTVYSVGAISPFLNSYVEKCDKKSFLFFGDVCNFSVIEYDDTINKLKERELICELAEQAVVLSNGLSTKMNRLCSASLCIRYQMVFVSMLILSLYFRR